MLGTVLLLRQRERAVERFGGREIVARLLQGEPEVGQLASASSNRRAA
jgi:hypothetical protein